MSDDRNIEHCPPDAEATIESIRSLGYDIGTAVADIIDNSITANARNIWITYLWDKNNSHIAIFDDGNGMNEKTLFQAMKLGSLSPKSIRDEKDLGRFGLGLKTASFSQCRQLTVMTKEKETSPIIKKWDLDYVSRVNEWNLLKSTDEKSIEIISEHLNSLDSGTCVLWQHLDRIVSLDADDDKNEDFFYEKIEKLREYVGMVFHRYLSGPKSIRIYISHPDRINEKHSRVTPWNPFSTQVRAHRYFSPETLTYKENKITAQMFILPHYSKYRTNEAFEKAGGPLGWNKHQGFFIYRNRRLLMPGGWLGFFKQEDHYKLARIKVDITNNMDEEWKIGVKKISVTPPDIFKKELKRIADIARTEAVKIYRYRGQIDRRSNTEIQSYVWKRYKNVHGRVSYKIDKKHPIIKKLIEEKSKKGSINQLLKLIESTIPIETIILSNRDEPDAHLSNKHSDYVDGLPIRDWYQMHLDFLMVEMNLSEEEAFKELISVEPFNNFIAEIETIRGVNN